MSGDHRTENKPLELRNYHCLLVLIIKIGTCVLYILVWYFFHFFFFFLVNYVCCIFKKYQSTADGDWALTIVRVTVL